MFINFFLQNCLQKPFCYKIFPNFPEICKFLIQQILCPSFISCLIHIWTAFLSEKVGSSHDMKLLYAIILWRYCLWIQKFMVPTYKSADLLLHQCPLQWQYIRNWRKGNGLSKQNKSKQHTHIHKHVRALVHTHASHLHSVSSKGLSLRFSRRIHMMLTSRNDVYIWMWWQSQELMNL